MTPGVNEGVDQSLSALGNGSVGPTELVLPALLVQHVLDHFFVFRLVHQVVNLYLFFLVSAPRVETVHDAIFLLLGQFFVVEELVLFVPVSEEKRHLSALFSVGFGHCSLLDEGAQRCQSGAHAHHHVGFVLVWGDAHRSCVHVAVQHLFVSFGVVSRRIFEVMRGQPVSVPSPGIRPVVVDDAQFQLVFADHFGGGGDGVQARLDARYLLCQLVHLFEHVWLHLDEISVGDVFLATHFLEFCGTFFGEQVFELLSVFFLVDSHREEVVETAGRLAKGVQHFGKQLVGGQSVAVRVDTSV